MDAIFAKLLVSAVLVAAEPDCKAVDARANEAGTRIPGHLAIHEVVGRGRLQFYCAPNMACAMPGVFVVPKDQLIAYVEYGSYTAVMYTNRKTEEEVQGWVLTERLRATGKGISPE